MNRINTLKTKINILNSSRSELIIKLDEVSEIVSNEKFTVKGMEVASLLAIVLGNSIGILEFGFNIVPIAISVAASSLVAVPIIIYEKKILKKRQKEMNQYSEKLDSIDELLESLSLELNDCLSKENRDTKKESIEPIIVNEFDKDIEKPKKLVKTKKIK